MEARSILKAILDNDELMEKHHYSKRDVETIDFDPEHDNDFLRFMQGAVQVMDEYQESTSRIMANRLIKFFEETYSYENP